MRTIRRFFALAAIVSLPACAPTVWDRPGTAPAEFSLDVEQCGLVAEDAARGRTHDHCMESKGYVASASGAPRGSRTRTDQPAQTANLLASTNIQYYRGTSAADLFRFDPKLAVNRATRQRALICLPMSAPILHCGIGFTATGGSSRIVPLWR